jgi:hypothetical protein
MLVCSALAVAIPISAQQSSSRGSRSAPTANQAATSAKKLDSAGVTLKLDALEAQNLKQRCDNFLKPLEVAPPPLKDAAAFERRQQAEKELSSRFAAESEEQLLDDWLQLESCVTDLPNRHSRHDAMDALVLLIEQEEERGLAWYRSTKSLDEEKKELEHREAQLKKQQEDFSEVANFAVALFKQNQQYKQAYEDEMRAYDRLSDLTDQVLSLAKQAVYRSPGFSWETWVNPPKPQIIRIEMPTVPRSLHCTSNTMPPAVPGLATWTWTDCQW